MASCHVILFALFPFSVCFDLSVRPHCSPTLNSSSLLTLFRHPQLLQLSPVTTLALSSRRSCLLPLSPLAALASRRSRCSCPCLPRCSCPRRPCRSRCSCPRRPCRSRCSCPRSPHHSRCSCPRRPRRSHLLLPLTAPLSHLPSLLALTSHRFSLPSSPLLVAPVHSCIPPLLPPGLLLFQPLTSLRLSAIAISVYLRSLLWLLFRFRRRLPPSPSTSHPLSSLQVAALAPFVMAVSPLHRLFVSRLPVCASSSVQ